MGTILHCGSRGAGVERLQNLLNEHLQVRPQLKIDGIFGPKTEAAVRRYQASVGIAIDGIAGPHTQAALERGHQHQAEIMPIPLTFTKAPWLSIAEQEIGQAQMPKERHNPRILQYHLSTSLNATDDETAWCSSFVNWCLREAGIQGTDSAQASSWLHWGKTSCPEAGAITIIRELNPPGSRSGYHVGFWIEDIGTHFKLLGGNQSSKVKFSNYPRSAWSPVGHRWPINGERRR